MAYEAEVERARAGDKNLQGADLGGADLTGVDLSGVDLTNANLGRTILRGADLRGANLSGANLKWAIMTGLDLKGRTDLTRANLTSGSQDGALYDGSDLSGADLSGVDLSRSWLSGTSLRGAVLIRANLSYSVLWMADFSGADLNGANLSGANLCGANLRDSFNFDKAIRTGAIFTTTTQFPQAPEDSVSYINDPQMNQAYEGNDRNEASPNFAERGGGIGRPDLEDAVRIDAKLDSAIILPDGSQWTSMNEIEDFLRFTHPGDPDFWRSEDSESPAYPGNIAD